MVKIYAEVFGCSSNLADYEIALGLLKEAGFEFTKDQKKSDLNLIFTCTVKIPTVNRMIYRLTELTKLKKPLIVAGCMPKTDRKIVERINPNASMIGPDSIEKIVDVAKDTFEGRKILFTKDLRRPKLCLPRMRRNPVIGIIPISIGCLGNCSYCSVKFARGRLSSYPIQMIVEEVRRSLKNGCREFYLTSQDNGCYGFDIGTSLNELLNEICKVEGKFFVRVGMMNPLHTKQILDGLIEAYKDEKIFKFLHLPVQSGSNKILELMNRGYKVEDFFKIVEKFRQEFPQLTLATDIIVGFPSETEEDFKKTVSLIESVRPDIINISKFGPRYGTEASRARQLSARIVNERSSALHEIVKQIALEKNKEWIEWKGEILIDEVGKNGSFVGRNFAYKPTVVKTKENILGKFVKIKVENVTENCLISEKL
jgi:MiaB-like tRNA modifying enzyme